MQWAFMRMEGVAMLWFQSWCLESLDADWETFTIALVSRFGKRNYGGVVEEQLTEEGEVITPNVVRVSCRVLGSHDFTCSGQPPVLRLCSGSFLCIAVVRIPFLL
jgi:hypothetical protein